MTVANPHHIVTSTLLLLKGPISVPAGRTPRLTCLAVTPSRVIRAPLFIRGDYLFSSRVRGAGVRDRKDRRRGGGLFLRRGAWRCGNGKKRRSHGFSHDEYARR